MIPHDRLLTKFAATELNWRVVVRIKKFILGRSQRVRGEGKLSEEARVTPGVPKGSVLGPVLFLVYVNDIWRNTESYIRLCAHDCIIYIKINDSGDIDKLQMDLNSLGNGR